MRKELTDSIGALEQIEGGMIADESQRSTSSTWLEALQFEVAHAEARAATKAGPAAASALRAKRYLLGPARFSTSRRDLPPPHSHGVTLDDGDRGSPGGEHLDELLVAIHRHHLFQRPMSGYGALAAVRSARHLAEHSAEPSAVWGSERGDAAEAGPGPVAAALQVGSSPERDVAEVDRCLRVRRAEQPTWWRVVGCDRRVKRMGHVGTRHGTP